MNKFVIPVLLSLSLGMSSCASGNGTEAKPQPAAQSSAAPVSIPVFNQDTAYKYIANQCAFGPRVPNTKAHDRCLLHLKGEMERLGADVKLQNAGLKAYDGTILNSTNIISSFYAERNNRVVLFSHWDSRPFSDHENDNPRDAKPVMAANDGASGVAVLMELARNISACDPQVGVDMVFLDAEDYGAPQWAKSKVEDDWCLGSQHWAKNHGYTAQNKPRVGILLDMVGAPNANFSIDGVSGYYAGSFAADFWRLAQGMGFSETFTSMQGGQIVDDHYYINLLAGIPTFDIIDYRTDRGFPEMWHTQHDDLAHIDPATLGIVGRVLMRYLYTNCAK